MNQVVFLEPNRLDAVLFTTLAEMNHRRVKDAIRKYQSQLLSFGLLGAYSSESSGDRPEEIIKLTEEQATFLITLPKNILKL